MLKSGTPAGRGTWRDDFVLYRHAIAVAPGASQIPLNLGVALEKIGRYNEAIANYETAQRGNENEPAPPLNMGLAYLLSGRPAQALAPLARAVQLQPSAPGPLYHYSRALLETGNIDEAVAQVRKALTRIASVHSIRWIENGLKAPARIICPRSAACPRPQACSRKAAAERRPWLEELRREIVEETG